MDGLYLYEITLLIIAWSASVCSLNGTTGNSSVYATPSSVSSSTTSEGCIFSSSGSNPVFTSGSTVFPPLTPGQPSRTIPCGEFLAFAHTDVQTHPIANSSHVLSPTSTTSQALTSSALSRSYLIDTDLTGCYAGTGGSTIYVATSGEYLWPNGTVTYPTATQQQTFTVDCSDWLQIPIVPFSIASSFERSPICTSYAQEWQQELNATGKVTGKYPPGVNVMAASSCSGSPATITIPASLVSGTSKKRVERNDLQAVAPSFATVDGTTYTFPSLYMAVQGGVTVRDRCGIRGSVYTNPIVAIPPAGLSTISFSRGLIPELGFETAAYDPAACPTYGVGPPILSSFWYTINRSSSIFTTTTDYTIGPPYNPILVPPPQLTSLDPEWAACSTWEDIDGGDFGVFSYGVYDPPHALTPQASPDSPWTISADPTTQATIFTTSKIGVLPASGESPSPPTATATATATINLDPTINRGVSSPIAQSQSPTSGLFSLTSDAPRLILPSSMSDVPVSAQHDPSADQHPSPPSASPNLAAIIMSAFGEIAVSTEQSSSIRPAQSGPVSSVQVTVITQISELADPDSPDRATNPLSSSPGLDSTVSADAGTQNSFHSPDAITIGGITLTPDGPAATISGRPVSLASSEILIIGTNAYSLSPSEAVIISGTPVSLPSSGVIIIGTDTFSLSPSEASAPVSLASSGVIIIGTNTFSISSAKVTGTPVSMASPEVIIIGTDTFSLSPTETTGPPVSLASSGVIIIGSNTFSSSSAKVTGTPVSFASSGIVIIGTKTFFQLPSEAASIGGIALPSIPATVSKIETILTVGGTGFTLSGTLVSLEPSGVLLIGSSTIILSAQTTLSIGGEIITANPTEIIIDGAVPTSSRTSVETKVPVTPIEPSRTILAGSNTASSEFLEPSSTIVPFEGAQGKVHIPVEIACTLAIFFLLVILTM